MQKPTAAAVPEETLGNMQARAAVLKQKRLVSNQDVKSLVTKVPSSQDGVMFDQIQKEPITWLREKYLPHGKLVLINGDSGIYKSFLSCDFAAHVTTGTPWPEGTPCEIGNVIMIAYEDDAGDTLIQRLEDSGADLSRIMDLSKVHRADPSLNGVERLSPFRLPDDMQRLRSAITRLKGVQLVVIDPISRACDQFENNRFMSNEVLIPLRDLAQDTGVCLVMINHLNKGGYHRKNVKTAVGGARALREIPRFSYLATKEQGKDGVVNLVQEKVNIQKAADMLSYTLVTSQDGRTFIQYLFDEEITPIAMFEDKNMSATRKKILTYMYVSERAMTPHEVAQSLGIAHTTVRSEMTRMLEQNLVVREDRGMYDLPVEQRKASVELREEQARLYAEIMKRIEALEISSQKKQALKEKFDILIDGGSFEYEEAYSISYQEITRGGGGARRGARGDGGKSKQADASTAAAMPDASTAAAASGNQTVNATLP